jgi:ferritin-like metal-binding protein YciE
VQVAKRCQDKARKAQRNAVGGHAVPPRRKLLALAKLHKLAASQLHYYGENMKPNSLQDLYVEQLRDLYDAEQQIIKALPEMVEASSSAELKRALEHHLDVTKTQVTRLDKIFAALSEKPKGEKCKGIEGVIDEGSDLINEVKDPDVRDAAIIASAQRVEHYEIAGYGTARTYATLLKDDEAGQLLQLTLDEEKEADQNLTGLASKINVKAAVGKSVEGETTTTRRSVA